MLLEGAGTRTKSSRYNRLSVHELRNRARAKENEYGAVLQNILRIRAKTRHLAHSRESMV